VVVQKGRKLFIADVIVTKRKRRFPNMQNLIFVFGIIILGYLILESYFNRKEVQKQQEKIQEKLESLKRSIEERKTINEEVEV
jgi:uncharacterized membrane-anchored protein YhcB (DUF1043 family)